MSNLEAVLIWALIATNGLWFIGFQAYRSVIKAHRKKYHDEYRNTRPKVTNTKGDKD